MEDIHMHLKAEKTDKKQLKTMGMALAFLSPFSFPLHLFVLAVVCPQQLISGDAVWFKQDQSSS